MQYQSCPQIIVTPGVTITPVALTPYCPCSTP